MIHGKICKLIRDLIELLLSGAVALGMEGLTVLVVDEVLL